MIQFGPGQKRERTTATAAWLARSRRCRRLPTTDENVSLWVISCMLEGRRGEDVWKWSHVCGIMRKSPHFGPQMGQNHVIFPVKHFYWPGLWGNYGTQAEIYVNQPRICKKIIFWLKPQEILWNVFNVKKVFRVPQLTWDGELQYTWVMQLRWQLLPTGCCRWIGVLPSTFIYVDLLRNTFASSSLWNCTTFMSALSRAEREILRCPLFRPKLSRLLWTHRNLAFHQLHKYHCCSPWSWKGKRPQDGSFSRVATRVSFKQKSCQPRRTFLRRKRSS